MIRSMPVLALLVLSASAPPSAARERREPLSASRDFGRFSLGITGGFQYWSLTALEGTLNERAELLARDGFALDRADFDITYAYGLEFQGMLNRDWFARGQVEWSPPAWNTRSSAVVGRLGGSGPRPRISVAYESKVRTDPVLVSLGAGRAVMRRSVRFGFSGNLIIAPVRVEDVLEVAIDGLPTESEVVASGTGLGLGANVSIDYFTDVRTTLYLDLFGRLGSTTVELEESWWESATLPRKRRIDFDGAGIRLGLRWY